MSVIETDWNFGSGEINMVRIIPGSYLWRREYYGYTKIMKALDLIMGKDFTVPI